MADENEQQKQREIKNNRLRKAIQPKGCSGGYVRREIWSEQQTPDWEFWLAMPKIKLWQACALSLNLEPDSIAPENDGMVGEYFFTQRKFPNLEIWNKFCKRVRLLEAHEQNQYGYPSLTIELIDFVKRAMNFLHPWDMPEELVALAKQLEEKNLMSPARQQEVTIAAGNDGKDGQEKNKQSINPVKNTKRVHELHDLITKVFTSLGKKSTNIEVWNALQSHNKLLDPGLSQDIENIIQEVDNNTIYWISWRGRERHMTRQSFNNFLSRLRNPQQ